MPSWGVGAHAAGDVLLPERPLEAAVSAYIRELRVLSLSVLDEAGLAVFVGRWNAAASRFCPKPTAKDCSQRVAGLERLPRLSPEPGIWDSDSSCYR